VNKRVLAALTAVLALAGCASSGTHDKSGQSASGQPTPSPVATPGLSASQQQFVSDMRTAFSFGSSVADGDLGDFGQQVCSDRQSGTSPAAEVSSARSAWSNTSKGDAVQMIVLAEKDICPDQLKRQTITYVVRGDSADVTYGPSGSDYTGTVPMTVTRRLGSPSYYAINAQLNGSGTVSCKLKVDGVTISSGSATGSYNIASCQIGQNLNTGSWENEN